MFTDWMDAVPQKGDAAPETSGMATPPARHRIRIPAEPGSKICKFRFLNGSRSLVPCTKSNNGPGILPSRCR